ncbi:MAG: hypothetical protein WBN88_18425, partial [Anderseniella sp.]
PRSNIVFKAGTVVGDRLYLCTQTEVLTYSLPGFEILDCLTHPWFNDLHHVKPNEAGNFLVAVTGLDLVVEITPTGKIVRELPVLDEDIWERFDRDRDYRKVLTTKPHHAHPNYVFEHGGDIFATRLNQKDAVCVTNRDRRGIEPGVEKLHDGIVAGDSVHFTAVDGHLVEADPATGALLKIHDLNAMTDTDKTLGWCRGLHLLGDDRALVGFSRIRPSKIRENVRWVKHRIGMRPDAGTLGTRVACYDLKAGRLEYEIPLEAEEMNAVFSIIPVD